MSLLKLLLLREVELSHQPPLCHILLPTILPSKWPELVLIVVFEPQSITVALALLFLFPLALTDFSLSYFTKELFKKPLKKNSKSSNRFSSYAER